MRVRSQRMLASAEEAGRISALLKEDISQLGAKSIRLSKGDIDIVDGVNGISGVNTDLSSYILPKGDFDELHFRKVHYDADGGCDAILDVKWFVQNDALIRSCQRINSSKCANINVAICPSGSWHDINMADNITEFSLLPSMPRANNEDLLSVGEGKFFYGAADIEGFNTLNFSPQNNDINGDPTPKHFYITENGLNGTCKEFTFFKDKEYVIEFRLPYRHCINNSGDNCSGDDINKISMFQAGRDHLSIGLRHKSMN
ncbi:MAG: hypothetical protein FWH22_08120, partial [Fibromonadales bacterium]|nr:hypothetical protein [Fibromonadales bacterium]